MTGRSKAVTLAELRRIVGRLIADARKDGAGPIADHWAEFAALVLKRAEECAK